jgi:NAD(P) transhydrogenase subunit alpha
MMRIGIPKESYPNERRVSLVPSLLPPLAASGFEVLVEEGAGASAGFPDADYREQGARVVGHREETFDADIVLQVRTPGANRSKGKLDLDRYRKGQVVVGFVEPFQAAEEIRSLAERGVTLFALELIPRTTRAQSMDALTSMSTLAGYKAVILAAEKLGRIFPMMITAAGTIPAANVLVIGAGVAGLQAIATSRRLGGVVKAYDVREAAREEIESLGAQFAALPLDTKEAGDRRGYARDLGQDFYQRQRRHLADLVRRVDVVITTAAVPGKPAPRLIDADMVERMVPGSVIVDLSAAQGGNCELTRADEIVERGDVTVLGPTNLPATLPYDASLMYSKNIVAFVENLVSDGKLILSLGDEIIRETLVLRDGQLVSSRLSEVLAKRS